MIFSFGVLGQERVEVDVQRYERAPVGEYWDDNWLTAEIRVNAGGFRGKASAAIITSELTKLLAELCSLFENRTSTAEFATIEEQLSLRLASDELGQTELRGEIADRPGNGNRLSFTMHLDQVQIGESIRELKQVLLHFPERLA